ncbi:MAG: alpha-glucan family phosphorylase [Chloroflexota bacterium]
MPERTPLVAYFSMEIAVDPRVPTYSGGLGVLAGDFLRGAADREFPIIGLTLLHRRGYFHQELDELGNQQETPEVWRVEELLEPLPQTCAVTVEGREVKLRAWKYPVVGQSGFEVPVYFLDSDLDGNDNFDRSLTGTLYGGDVRYRLCQEQLLGAGGLRMVRALGHATLPTFHINEGHGALVFPELVLEAAGSSSSNPWEVLWGTTRCVFTTHTPIAAGHDEFPLDLAAQVIGPERLRILQELGCCNDSLHLTLVALQLGGYANAVAKSHRSVTSAMFPEYAIDSITNGVHSATWTAPPFQRLFDQYTPAWRRDSRTLAKAGRIPADAIWAAHLEAKQDLVAEVRSRTGVNLDPDAFTLAFARRATTYKRLDLVFSDLDRLLAIAKRRGPLQIVCGGKAHPQDGPGKEAIRRLVAAGTRLGSQIQVVFLANYEVELAQRVVAGGDVWLNTPVPPLEASGTSGMKAAHNGVPSLSVLDGWWCEGHAEGVTGWSIGDGTGSTVEVRDDAGDAEDLYCKLESEIMPMFYGNRAAWTALMRNTISQNAAMFNAHRMFVEYLVRAYREEETFRG